MWFVVTDAQMLLITPALKWSRSLRVIGIARTVSQKYSRRDGLVTVMLISKSHLKAEIRIKMGVAFQLDAEPDAEN